MREHLGNGSSLHLRIAALLSGILFSMGLGFVWLAALGESPLAHPLPITGMLLLGMVGLLLSVAAGFKSQAAALESTLRTLQETNTILVSVGAGTLDAIVIKDLEGRILSINPTGAALLGRPMEELLGRTEIEVLGAEQGAHVIDRDRITLEANRPLRFEERLTLADGKEHVFSSIRFPYRKPDGSLGGIITIHHDISDHLHEETLRKRLAAIVTASYDAIVSVDPQHQTLQLWNPGAERLFGYSAAEAIGKPVSLVVPPDRMAETTEIFRRVQRGERPEPFESVRVAKGGRRLEVWVSLFAVRDEDGKIQNFTAILRDLTEFHRVQAEVASRTAELQKARELNQLKDHFLSMLSHEIKTPLSLICGYTELLEEKYPGDELLAGVLEGTWRLNDHVTTLLEYSALLSGTLRLSPSDVNLAEVGQHVAQVMTEPMRKHGLELSVEVDPETPVIRGDFRRISEMILKLVENAEKFTPAGGKAGVRIGPSGDEVRIDVWDTGPGIPEREFARIWEAFTQLEIGDASRKSGLGLGLSVVKKLAELHGGRVAVVSQPGSGTTFTVFLPLEKRVEATAAPAAAPSTAEAGPGLDSRLARP